MGEKETSTCWEGVFKNKVSKIEIKMGTLINVVYVEFFFLDHKSAIKNLNRKFDILSSGKQL